MFKNGKLKIFPRQFFRKNFNNPASVLNLDCKLEIELDWNNQKCSVDQFRSASNVTGCICKETPEKFKVGTSISVPITTIDFDSIFVDSCKNCADPG